jgi:hypothetical protein
MAAHDLLHPLREANWPDLAVVGLRKNTGKTVTLNHLLALAQGESLRVGLTSIGRDGEDRDQVFDFPKPAVEVWPGMLVATARDTLPRARCAFQVLDATGLSSPMGDVVLVRVLARGQMEVAGPTRRSALQAVMAQMHQAGCDWVLLDGALGRSHHASPALARAVVLATGAALGPTVQDVVRKTVERLALLQTPVASPGLADQCRSLFETGGVAMWDAQGNSLYGQTVPTLNAAPIVLEHLDQPVAVLAMSGAVGRALWSAVLALARHQHGLTVVVADATRLFVQHADVLALQALGGQLCVHSAIRLLGVTVNPFSPQGFHLDPDELLGAMRRAVPNLVVADVLSDWQARPNPSRPLLRTQPCPS